MMDMEKCQSIIEKYKGDKSSLIAILQDMQSEFNYLPREALEELSEKIEIPLARIYSVATFFKAFSLKPKGKHQIQVCLGTACHVKGGQRIMDKILDELHIKSGETTPDLLFSADEVRCVGCCGLAPVIMIGQDVHGKITPTRVSSTLKAYKK